MAPSCLGTQPTASIEEHVNQEHAESFDEKTLINGSSMLKQQASESSCENFDKFVGEPEKEPDGDDLDEDTVEASFEGASRQVTDMPDSSEASLQVIDVPDCSEKDSADRRKIEENASFLGDSLRVTTWADCNDEDWEPVRRSGIQRQDTDEKWPTYSVDVPESETDNVNPLIESRPPGTFFPPSREEPLEQTVDAMNMATMVPYPSVDAMNMATMVAYPSINAMNMAPMIPHYGTVCVLPLFPQTMQDGGNLRTARKKRNKRESPLDKAKREKGHDNDIKFCPWCGGRFRPEYNFCMYCGGEYNARGSK
jgi:hypothetical protein